MKIAPIARLCPSVVASPNIGERGYRSPLGCAPPMPHDVMWKYVIIGDGLRDALDPRIRGRILAFFSLTDMRDWRRGPAGS